MFVLATDGRHAWEPAEMARRFAAYRAYLDDARARMPPSAWDFATAPWHHDFTDHRSPHDGWIEALAVREVAAGERGQVRRVEIHVRVLGAYHDGHLELTYTDVAAYGLAHAGGRDPRSGHGDWLYDEVRLSAGGRVVHEVELADGRWLIECADLAAVWLPLAR